MKITKVKEVNSISELKTDLRNKDKDNNKDSNNKDSNNKNKFEDKLKSAIENVKAT